jgi:predicted metalloenzyme YecM
MFAWLDNMWGICTREWDLEMMAAFAIVSEEVCHRSISVRSIRQAQPVRKAYYKYAKKTYNDMLNGKPVDIAKAR